MLFFAKFRAKVRKKYDLTAILCLVLVVNLVKMT